SFRRVGITLSHQKMHSSRAASEGDSLAFKGSSTTILLPRNPVARPPTDIANRKPLRELENSPFAFSSVESFHFGRNVSRYQSLFTMSRQRTESRSARSIA